MAGALSGVHRLHVDKPHAFKPEEERKHGGKTHHVHGKEHHHKLGRKRGGSVKKKRDDGGNVTTVAKTTPPPPPTGNPDIDELTKQIRQLKSVVAPWKGKRSPIDAPGHAEEQPNKFARGGHVGQDGRSSHHGTDATPDRGLKFGSHVQPTAMAGTESGYGGKFAHGKGRIEDSLRRGGHVKKKRDEGGKVTTVNKTMTGPYSEPPYAPSPPSRIPKGEDPLHDLNDQLGRLYSQEFRDTRSLAAARSGKQTPIDAPDHADGGKVKWLHNHHAKHGGKLTYQERKHLKSSSFVFPGERRYPIEDESHARNALARVSQHGSSSEKAKVRAAVHRKYPGIVQKHKD